MDIDPRVAALVASVSEERLGALLQTLASFETRGTFSSTDSPTRGIGAARQGFITRDVDLRNVMAVLPGRSPRRIYISGHYDSLARPGGQGEANAGRAAGAAGHESTISAYVPPPRAQIAITATPGR